MFNTCFASMTICVRLGTLELLLSEIFALQEQLDGLILYHVVSSVLQVLRCLGVIQLYAVAKRCRHGKIRSHRVEK